MSLPAPQIGNETAGVKKMVNFVEFLPHFAHPFLAHQINFDIIIPGTSSTQPRVKLTAEPMCIEMGGWSDKLELQVRRPTKSFHVAFKQSFLVFHQWKWPGPK